MSFMKWIKPGLGIKRWIFLGLIGIISFSFGLSTIFYKTVFNLVQNWIIITCLIIVGVILIVFSIKKSIQSILKVVCNYKGYNALDKETINKLLYKEKILNKGPKIVVIGGGTGLSVLLRGLKEYTSNITAIVTVADDGGGSGILREDLGMLPPGDIRSCLVALANTEPTMEKILQYRFKEGSLKGQSFGNLFIAAMNEIYGNFEVAIKEISNVLAVTGRVLPMTTESVKLYAKLKNGKVIEGESNIPVKSKEADSEIDHVFIKPRKLRPLEEALDVIREADCVVLGPGSLYTSVIPNLLINDLVKEIEKSQAIKVYITNVMTQPGETDNYGVVDHIDAISKHTKKSIIDYVITNIERIPPYTLIKYHEDGAKPVIITDEEEEELLSRGIGVIKDNLVDVKKNYIRHDAKKLSEIITNLVLNKRFKI
ncbi:putative gluconeogenesis factor [Gottschalkia purinilytica]|uniref:Putative gluconeogenesis factor n=1 Tax=Gottschalkia purinilytica TaxID=1503 RepID=A0A0L0WCK5_GOTPU|nr:YvcK family protein [Gottschalkia purinilytica]KNF09145.1 putative gluconeogenesis factor [Gottschalkia purinilytica]